MQEALDELTARVRKAHSDSLISIILYGSAAADNADAYSDLNVLCVLNQVTPAELAAAEPNFRWWRKRGNPSPLLMSEDEVRTSADSFPIEFHDMQERRRVLYGRDVVTDLRVDPRNYRAQVEHELRAKLLRLRQKAGAVLSDDKALLRLMLDSVSTFCVLARHALLVCGVQVGWTRRQVAERLCELGADASPFNLLLDVREQKSPAARVEAVPLFGAYLKQIEAIVARVDQLRCGDNGDR